MNKKPVLIGITVLVLALALIGVSRYLTRPASAPTQVPGSTETKPVLEGERTYRISEGSKAEFRIGEILRDKPFTAIGTTSNILGDIILSNAALGFGTIKVNARTFKTDSENRDGAIARMILKSEKPENEWITFRTTGISGLPASAPMNRDLSFSMTGELTIAGVTKSVTFSTVMKITEAAITGTATTTLKRSDFNLTTPNIPFVASVDDSFPISVTIIAPVVAK
ncbi:MAG: YceI family protein [Candidatus Pacebacteria bacterium]|nr:YceI family protein [Candidatus Paceibacterota bacterium]